MKEKIIKEIEKNKNKYICIHEKGIKVPITAGKKTKEIIKDLEEYLNDGALEIEKYEIDNGVSMTEIYIETN